MILTGPEIQRVMLNPTETDRIVISPFKPEHVGPNSYDVRLGDTLRVYSIGSVPLNPDDELQTAAIPVDDSGRWLLTPSVLYLGSTLEYTETFGFAPRLEGRSSIARLGVKVHLTAGFGDDGFKGHWTLEIEVTHPIYLRPGMRIAQISYQTIRGERKPYKGRYQGQPDQPVASRFHLG